MIRHRPVVTPPSELASAGRVGTLSGELIDVGCPQIDRIHIEDIAAGLANTCRWGGQIRERYSVAEHALACSKVGQALELPLHTQLALLHHDDTEAFLCDIPFPLKQILFEYKRIELEFEKVIAQKFGFPYPWDVHVKAIDRVMLLAEAKRFKRPDHWFGSEKPPVHFLALCHLTVEAQLEVTDRRPASLQLDFLRRHDELTIAIKATK